MRQNFEIVNMFNEDVKEVVVRFKYKGYVISASKIFHAKIYAFDESDNEVYEGDDIEGVI